MVHFSCLLSLPNPGQDRSTVYKESSLNQQRPAITNPSNMTNDFGVLDWTEKLSMLARRQTFIMLFISMYFNHRFDKPLLWEIESPSLLLPSVIQIEIVQFVVALCSVVFSGDCPQLRKISHCCVQKWAFMNLIAPVVSRLLIAPAIYQHQHFGLQVCQCQVSSHVKTSFMAVSANEFKQRRVR